MKLLVALALAGTALVQGDSFDKSWESKHWGVVTVVGNAPERAAIVIDRESIVTGAKPNLREFNFLSTVEGMPERWGIFGKLRADCDAMATQELGSAEFYEGKRNDRAPMQTALTPIGGNAPLRAAVTAVCTGNWNGIELIDGPAGVLQARVFK